MSWRFGTDTIVESPLGLAGDVDYTEDVVGLGILDFSPIEDPAFLAVLAFSFQVTPWVKSKPWTLQLCHASNTIATCTAYEFSALPLRNEPGDWSLEFSSAGVPAVGYLDPEGLETGYVGFDPRDVTDVRLVAEGRILFAGAVRGDNGGFYATRDRDGERWRLSGIELGWDVLGSRIVYPDPATEAPWADEFDTRTGIASSVLAAYIEANAGTAALAGRQIAGLEVSDESVGASDDFTASQDDTLADLATRIGNDYGFEVIPEYDFDGTITYRLSTARDMSGVVVFSDQGDLRDSTARFQLREATYVLTGGTGDGAARIFRTATTGATGSDRREAFSDESSLDTAGQVQANANAVLTADGEQFQMTTTLTDSLATAAINFGLRLGDRVGIIVRGRRYIAPIEAVQFEVTSKGQVMRPRFGAAQPDELRQLLRRIDQR